MIFLFFSLIYILVARSQYPDERTMHRQCTKALQTRRSKKLPRKTKASKLAPIAAFMPVAAPALPRWQGI